jgi:glucose-6-phosphate 1-dehydrogenase
VTDFGRSQVDERAFAQFAKRLRYVPAKSNPGSALAKLLRLPRRIVYLAVPPSSFESILNELKDAGLHRGASIIIEKPFGRDLASAGRSTKPCTASCRRNASTGSTTTWAKRPSRICWFSALETA